MMPAAKKRLLYVAALAGLVGLAAFVHHYIDRRLPYYHFRTVEEGVFYRTGQLTGDEFEEAIQDYGFKTIINLREEAARTRGDWYEQEKAVAARMKVRLVDVPLLGDHPPSKEQLPLLYAVFDDPNAYPVLVHCEFGSVRSAALEGFWRREYKGEGGDEAYANVEQWSHDLEVDAPDIVRFIREYVPRKKSP